MTILKLKKEIKNIMGKDRKIIRVAKNDGGDIYEIEKMKGLFQLKRRDKERYIFKRI